MSSLKQVQATKNWLANGGNMSKAMRDANYSPAMARNPQKLTQSKAFRELIDEIAPDVEVAAELRNLMYASKLENHVFPLSFTDDEIQELIESLAGCKLKKIKHGDMATWAYYWTPDNKSKKDAIELLMKARGQFAPQKVEFVDPNEKLSNPELDAKIAELEERKRLSLPE